MRRTSRRPPAAAVLCTALALTGGCALSDSDAVRVGSAGADVSVLAGEQNHAVDPAVTVGAAGRLTGRVQRADLVLVGRRTLPPTVLRRVTRTDGVDAAVRLAMATAPVGGRMVTLGAVDPATYRRLTPEVTARADAVWQRVAEGDLAISPELADELRQDLGGDLVLGNEAGSLAIRVGAEASMAPKIDAVVNEAWGRRLGMVPGNAVLVSVGRADPADVAEVLRRRVGPAATVTPLTESLPAEGQQTAFLTGGSVADAVGSFSYRYYEDGTVDPDPGWAAANLRTEAVPILGNVTCHRVMLPQLRA
ncbi:MAG TPA: hypothetical protein VFY11_04100, partial [Nocardioidaceae bacterium]|nr:hypothetical protein [Nocardioidaceae bacterium]